VNNPPNGCAVCGEVADQHVQQWHHSVGWHRWIAPSNAQRLARLRRNRELRYRNTLKELR